MAKYYGKVGYATNVEKKPGVWVSDIVERPYAGDVLKNYRRLESAQQVNDNINVSLDISIVADPFAYQNFHQIVYIEYMGTKWKVSSVEPQYPRLLLSIGGVYNGEE